MLVPHTAAAACGPCSGLMLFESDAVLAIRSEEERAAAVAAVEKKMPRAVKRKRRVVTEDGIDAGMEEYLVRWAGPGVSGSRVHGATACGCGKSASVLCASACRC